MLRYKTEIAWFSRLVWHPARKWSGSILTTRSPHGSTFSVKHRSNFHWMPFLNATPNSVGKSSNWTWVHDKHWAIFKKHNKKDKAKVQILQVEWQIARPLPPVVSSPVRVLFVVWPNCWHQVHSDAVPRFWCFRWWFLSRPVSHATSKCQPVLADESDHMKHNSISLVTEAKTSCTSDRLLPTDDEQWLPNCTLTFDFPIWWGYWCQTADERLGDLLPRCT